MKKKIQIIVSLLILLLPLATSTQQVLAQSSTVESSNEVATSSTEKLEPDISLEKMYQKAATATSTSESAEQETLNSETEKVETETDEMVSEKKDISKASLQKSQETFNVRMAQEGSDIILRESAESEVSAEWKITTKYELLVQLKDRYETTNSRKIEIKTAPGLLLERQAVKDLENHDYINKVTIEEERSEPIYGINANFKQSEFYANNERNLQYQNYIHNGKVVVELRADIPTTGFSLYVLTAYLDGQSVTVPSAWSGVQGQRLNRAQPALHLELIEDAQKETRTLDQVTNSSTVANSVQIKNNAIKDSQNPGPQLLNKEIGLTIVSRVRNEVENPADNNYHLSNPTYELYLPYKKSETEVGKFVSADLLDTKMDQWIADITASNANQPLFKYEKISQPDGRVKIRYFFTDQTEEYLIQTLNLQLFYQYPETNFKVEDTVYYTANNLGRTLTSYYDDKAETMTIPVTDSTSNLKIVDEQTFDFAYLHNAGVNTLTNNVIKTRGEHNNDLLGYTQITNKTTAKGEADVHYAFDTGNTWNIGVTMVQFWTADDKAFSSIEEARNYNYEFQFTLQKRGSTGEQDKLSGHYTLIPAKAYQGKKITQNFGVERDLLGYVNERYYYYVNREMLVQGLASSKPADISDYYIKELSYTYKVAAKDDGQYISGDSGRAREGGGQYYGRTFGEVNQTALSTMKIEPTAGNQGNILMRTVTTKLIKNSSSYADIGLFIDGNRSVSNQTEPMKVVDSKGNQLMTSSQRVDVGETLTVSGRAVPTFYPYGSTNYAPDPIFFIRTPAALTLDETSIQLNQDGQSLDYKVTQLKNENGEPTYLDSGGFLYRVEPIDSKGLGYFDEEREMYGKPISIQYNVEVNIASEGRAIKYRELLFVGDKNYAAYLSGSYANYLQIDEWGIGEKILEQGWGNLYTKDNISYLASTSLQYEFVTNSPNLNFGLGTKLGSNVIDPNDDGSKSKGVLDDEQTTFDATFSMDNIHQKGYVDKDGMFIAYLPIAKQDIKPEWLIEAETLDFSLVLKEKLTITSQKNIQYEIGYTTEKERFNNNQASFSSDGGKFAEYRTFSEVEDQLDQVTMIKIIGRANSEGMIIPFGEQMKATIKLGYDKEALGKTHDFDQLAGEKVSFRPYVIQNYTINRVVNNFRIEAPKNEIRIRYRPEQKEIKLWAYNEADYNDPSLNKTADLVLPNFVNSHELTAAAGNFYSFNLASIEEMAEQQDSSVTYGNSTFAIGTGLNLTGDPPPYLDLAQLEESIGKTAAANQLNYKVYNAKNINDTLGERSLVIHYQSKDSDDLDFKVKLNIARKASKIEMKNDLIAGKVYKEFVASENERKTPIDGAFTVQYAYDTHALEELPDGASPYIEFEKQALPKNDTIMLKVQSKVADNSVKPEYYYYQNKSGDAQKRILLTEFNKMGANDQKLTLTEISDHIKTADQLSYLFIFDFEKQDTEIGADAVALALLTTEDEKAPTFETTKKTVVKKQDVKTDKSTYEQGEPIEVSGTFKVDKVLDAVDSFNQYKLLSLNAQLVEVTDGAETVIDWPQGTVAQLKAGGAEYQPRKVGANTQFIMPFGRVDPNDHQPGVSLPESPVGRPFNYQIKTEVEQLDADKDYLIRLGTHKARSSFYPLGGEAIPIVQMNNGTETAIGKTIDLPLKVTPATKNGLRVSTTMKERLIYNQSTNQQVNFTFDTDNINEIRPVLEMQKNGTVFETVDWANYVTDPSQLASLTSLTDWQLKFKDQLSPELNGEYRIVFYAYQAGKEEPVQAVPWSFALWDPLA